MTLREQIARIIAPSGWDWFDQETREFPADPREERMATIGPIQSSLAKADAILALLPAPALPEGCEPTDDQVRDWAYRTLATDTEGDTPGVWWSTITPARKGMYRRAMIAARPAAPMRMLVDQDWLNRTVEADPDVDAEAGPARPAAPSGWDDAAVERAARVAVDTFTSGNAMFQHYGAETQQRWRDVVRAILTLPAAPTNTVTLADGSVVEAPETPPPTYVGMHRAVPQESGRDEQEDMRPGWQRNLEHSFSPDPPWVAPSNIWGRTYIRYLRKGHDHGSAAFEADKAERQAKRSTTPPETER